MFHPSPLSISYTSMLFPHLAAFLPPSQIIKDIKTPCNANPLDTSYFMLASQPAQKVKKKRYTRIRIIR